jgi:hypothetical protein
VADTLKGLAAHGLFIDDADRVLTASHLARLVGPAIAEVHQPGH